MSGAVSDNGPRVVLVTGKGGVGKTTTAAAVAVRAARSGVRTLVLSTDAAHSLGDALDLDLDGGALADVEPGLSARQVGGTASASASWGVVQDYLLRVLAAVGTDPVLAEELSSLPGAAEVAALLDVHRHATSGAFDMVVVDCAPTAETLRLLALPEALAWHLDRLLPAQRGLLTALRPAAVAAAGLPVPSAEVVQALAGWGRRLRDVRTLLTGPTASVRLVLTPEKLVVAEARRTWTSLALFGYAVDGLVVGRLLPEPAHDEPWLRAWNGAQTAGLAEIAASFPGMPVVRLPYLGAEPVGPDALNALASAAGAGPDPFGVLEPLRQSGLRVRRAGTGFVLTLPLPLTDAGGVDLKRRGDELLVMVGGQRRVLSLPAALRRCTVRGAGVADGALRVRFEPDPEQWPERPEHRPEQPPERRSELASEPGPAAAHG